MSRKVPREEFLSTSSRAAAGMSLVPCQTLPSRRANVLVIRTNQERSWETSSKAFDGRFEFGRWFSPGDHHRPASWSTFLAQNDLELNRLIDDEVDVDDGYYLPGTSDLWT